MNPDKDKNFDQSMRQLLHLLKKILKNPPSQDQISQISPLMKESGVNLNLCFFTFLPIDSEELDELEEIYDHFLFQEDKGEKPEAFSSELNPDDIDFLGRHGIKF